MSLLRKARRLAGQGRFVDALVPAETATHMCRRLAEVDRACLPGLARALTSVGLLRSEVSWESAVASAQEATDIYQELASSTPGALPDVAGALSRLLTFLWETSAISAARSPSTLNVEDE